MPRQWPIWQALYFPLKKVDTAALQERPSVMPRPSAARNVRRKTRRSRTRRFRASHLWPNARVRRRWRRAYWRASPAVKLIIGAAFVLTLALAINWVYQVVGKPSELLFPVSGALYKTPRETWQEYGPLFRKYSTDVMTPDLLAGIAQVESSGNPIVRTYWRWSWTTQPFEMYRPASSAVGMYQITEGTFAEARHYCIRHHRVIEDGPWNHWRSCWFNSLYARVVPADAVELTAAYLDRRVALIVQRHRTPAASLLRQQRLAVVIHLCGAAAGDVFARRGYRLMGGQRCGDHDVRRYLAAVDAMRGVFERLAREHSVGHLRIA
jgi:hypothetical protein